MWFRRKRRRQESPVPVVLPPLDRLSELVERVVVLLDQAPAPVAAPAPIPPPAVAAEPEPEPPPPLGSHLLFVPDAAGYRLLERVGEVPTRGSVLELEAGLRRVIRIGGSPLPGDRRRCAFLEQEPLEQERTPTGARGESDRGDEGGAQG
jgi:hypothetical protein